MAIKIRAKNGPFTRFGLIFTSTWRTFADGTLTLKQVDCFKKEPNLEVVSVIDEETIKKVEATTEMQPEKPKKKGRPTKPKKKAAK